MGNGARFLAIGMFVLMLSLKSDKLSLFLIASMVGYIFIFLGGYYINKEWERITKIIEEIKKQKKEE